MSNKFIWQKNRRGFDYLLVSDKTLNSYGDDDQDLGILARIIKRKNVFVVFLPNDVSFFGNSPWANLSFDMDDELDYDQREMTTLYFDYIMNAKDFIENYWEKTIFGSVSALRDQYSDERMNLFSQYTNLRRWHEGNKDEMERERKERESQLSERELVDVFLCDLEEEKETLDSIWNDYEKKDSLLKKQYDNYCNAISSLNVSLK